MLTRLRNVSLGPGLTWKFHVKAGKALLTWSFHVKQLQKGQDINSVLYYTYTHELKRYLGRLLKNSQATIL